MQRLAALAMAIALSILTLEPVFAGCGPAGIQLLPTSAASAVKITIRTSSGQPAFGTGVIWDSDGHIVTNDHVATVGDRHIVTLADGEHRAARIVARAPDQDLALLSVDGPLPPAARRAPAGSLQPGDSVLAIGNPFGQGTTISTGIVNGFGREVITAPDRHMMGMVETTVPLRPGNSGGPLLSCRGEVVGINTAAVQTAPGGSTLGFAIPMEIADAAVARMLRADTAVAAAPDFGSRFPAESGTVQRGSARPGLGLYVVPGGSALVVQQVVPGSPAARAGAMPGDAIIEANGRMVSSPEELQSLVHDATVGTIAVLRILRSGVALDMAVRITPVVFSP